MRTLHTPGTLRRRCGLCGPVLLLVLLGCAAPTEHISAPQQHHAAPPSDKDPAEEIYDMVGQGKHKEAIAAFEQLPSTVAGVPYVHAATATSLAYATLAAQQKNPAARTLMLDRAVATLPNMTRGRGFVPVELRPDLESVQAIVVMTIEALKADMRRRETSPPDQGAQP